MTVAPTSEERTYWNEWNVRRESTRGRISTDQRAVVLRWLDALGRRDLRLIDIGCGAGWLCEDLQHYGRTTGTDLSDEVLARAAQRLPRVTFVAGDFLELDFGEDRYDVAISLEALSHVADQPAFLAKIAALLKPGDLLMMATQNRPTLERNSIPPPGHGQRRHWVDRHELRTLLEAHFDVEELFSITPKYDRGLLKIINSDRVRRVLGQVGLGFVRDAVNRVQERAWMGWTLMALARKR